MRPFSAVVVGTGFIGPVHVEALRRAGINVRGVVGSSADKSRVAAERWGLAKAYESLEDVLADSAVDAVHLTTPNVLHYQQAKSVLAAGKHCLCEKPLSMNSQESSELVQLASQSGLAAGVAYNVRFYPLCHEARERISSGAIGEVVHVTGSYVQDWLLHETDFNWRVIAEEGGVLRAVADIGTHWLDLIQFITGKSVSSVCADLRTVHTQRFRPPDGVETFSHRDTNLSELLAIKIATEDCGSIMLRFEDGTNGCLWVSQVTAGRKNCLRFELAGTKAAMEWNSESPNQLWLGHRQQPNELLVRDPALLAPSAAAISSYPGGHNEGFSDTFKQLFRSFYGYIAAGDFNAPPPYPTFVDGHREILLCEAILASHRQRRWIEIA
jgi:predicted dehydrogenase